MYAYCILYSVRIVVCIFLIGKSCRLCIISFALQHSLRALAAAAACNKGDDGAIETKCELKLKQEDLATF